VLEASRKVGLEVNTEKTTYTVVSHNHSLLIADKSFKMCQSPSIWEQQQQIKVVFSKKLEQIKYGRTRVTILFRVSCLPISSLKT